MRKCTYCGKEYPDDIAVCAVDGEQLTGLPSDASPAPAAPPPLTQRQQMLLVTLVRTLRALWLLELTMAVWNLAAGQAINPLHPYNLALMGLTFAAAVLIWFSARWTCLLAAIFGIVAQLMVAFQLWTIMTAFGGFGDKVSHRFSFGPFEVEGIWGLVLVCALPSLLLAGSFILLLATLRRR